METVLVDCLAQFQANKSVLKEEQHQAVLGLLAKGCRGGSSYGFWNSETRTKRKERGIVVASPLQSTINDQVEAMREAGISAIALPCHGTMR